MDISHLFFTFEALKAFQRDAELNIALHLNVK